MANSVYNTVCEALSRIVSRRAAENIVREALVSANTDPQRVTAEQMQLLLKNVVFARLQQVIPVAQAKGEIKAILSSLEHSLAKPGTPTALSPEVQEGLNALQTEFRPYAKLIQPRAQRLRASIEALPKDADPVKALNALWAELDLLQLELSGRAPPAPLPSAFSADTHSIALQSGEFPVSFDLEHSLVAPPTPASVAVAEPPPLPSTSFALRVNAPAGGAIGPISLPPIAALASVPVPPVSDAIPVRSAPKVAFDLETDEGREALLTHLALEEGVVGVLLTDRRGRVWAERLSSGDADHLAAVVAATTLLLDKHRGFKVFYTHLAEVSAFIGLAGQRIVTVLSDDNVNVGRVLTALETLQEGL
jgi:hypothetical protein